MTRMATVQSQTADALTASLPAAEIEKRPGTGSPDRVTALAGAGSVLGPERGSRGASIVLALLFFAMCAMVGSVVLTAASVASGRTAEMKNSARNQAALESAARVLCAELEDSSLVLESGDQDIDSLKGFLSGVKLVLYGQYADKTGREKLEISDSVDATIQNGIGYYDRTGAFSDILFGLMTEMTEKYLEKQDAETGLKDDVDLNHVSESLTDEAEPAPVKAVVYLSVTAADESGSDIGQEIPGVKGEFQLNPDFSFDIRLSLASLSVSAGETQMLEDENGIFLDVRVPTSAHIYILDQDANELREEGSESQTYRYVQFDFRFREPQLRVYSS